MIMQIYLQNNFVLYLGDYVKIIHIFKFLYIFYKNMSLYFF